MRSRERLCSDITQLNEYMKAYFANIHPLLPILHKEAFLKLYRLYGLKVQADNIRTIMDASTREGRAVSLICSVLALGALSLVETRNESGIDTSVPLLVQFPNFGEALGFYGACLRLLAYTHDTIETMITYLLMVLSFVPIVNLLERVRNSDHRCKGYNGVALGKLIKLEAYRRLHCFQTQAIALNFARKLEEKEPTDLYDQDLWPGVTNLVIYEMAKRSWSLFKLYLSSVALELGRSANFDSLDIERPILVDDDVSRKVYLANVR